MEHGHNENTVENSLLLHIKEYWIFYIFIANLIITFTTTSTRLTSLEVRADKGDIVQEQQNNIELDIRTRLASIDTTLQFLKANQTK